VFLRSFLLHVINPLSANVEYTPHDGDVTCSVCGASYRENDFSERGLALKGR